MTTVYPFWLGGVAASMAASCTHPLDLTKVRMQTIKAGPGIKPPSMFFVLRKSIVQQGLRGIYTGLTASLLRQMSYSLVRIGAYEEMKRWLSQNGKPSSMQLLAAACLAGGLGGIAGNPADILLVRMTSDVIKPQEHRFNYSNALSGLANLAEQEGIKGMARGLGTNVARAMLMNASQVGSYDLFKSALLNRTIPVLDYQLHDSLALHTLSSLLAGTFATTVCSPADVLRTRVMTSTANDSVLHILKTSLQKEGPKFLFKGWTPAFIRLGPNTVLLFVFYEQLKKGWSTLNAA
ncbi:mitochondrial carrier domain-containing protein [Lentinula detonsa]|uniref:Mitochondrial carrier domain-containing protein n=2 Tax=Lentinula TaxID=5352 RepID=A0AA38U5W1_9AGAR|nr:mitochondrial carrier domain-containing protein [Lentinula detonsa]KAJ3789690.1 mitochondrial carrier domain-containing protein [Lentinula aff. detonsa]KAJ3802611.1 mitochondrial carrier domain-containing protein [Lentinula aff. detonsa]